MKVEIRTLGEKYWATYTDVKKIERNVVFTIIYVKDEKILNAISVENSSIKQMVITNDI